MAKTERRNMCGIMGYYAFGDILPDKGKISKMFELLETRGRNASGFAFIQEEQLHVHKDAITSSEMIRTEAWNKLILPKIMIFHTRAATKGTVKNNCNNHPIFNKYGMAIVHNGIIHNDNEIFGKKGKRDGEVDSEAILSLLSSCNKGDKIKMLFDKLDGSFAVAFIDRNFPDKLTLIKKDNPICMYYNRNDDILYFCSEKRIMQTALGIETEYKRGFPMGETGYHFCDMSDNHSLIIDKSGVESYQKYKAKSFINYGTVSEIECPHCLNITEFDYMALHNICIHCGNRLIPEEIFDYGMY